MGLYTAYFPSAVDHRSKYCNTPRITLSHNTLDITILGNFPNRKVHFYKYFLMCVCVCVCVNVLW